MTTVYIRRSGPAATPWRWTLIDRKPWPTLVIREWGIVGVTPPSVHGTARTWEDARDTGLAALRHWERGRMTVAEYLLQRNGTSWYP